MRGKGFNRTNARGGAGDHYVHFKVRVPSVSDLSPRETRLLEELRALELGLPWKTDEGEGEGDGDGDGDENGKGKGGSGSGSGSSDGSGGAGSIGDGDGSSGEGGFVKTVKSLFAGGGGGGGGGGSSEGETSNRVEVTHEESDEERHREAKA